MPARLLPRCVAPGCQQAQAESYPLCDGHIHGTIPWYQQHSRVVRGPRRRTVVAANPWSGQHACPSCGGDTWTMPVDPVPDVSARMGRKQWPANLWTCVACSTTWTLARTASVTPSPAVAGAVRGGGRRSAQSGVEMSPAAPNKVQPGSANSPAGSTLPNQGQKAG